MIKGIAFDLDGVLIDSEQVWYEVHRNVFAEYGVMISEEDHKNFWIRTSLGTRGITRKHGIGYDEVMSKMAKEGLRLAGRIKPMPGALELISRLEPHVSFAIVSYAMKYAVRHSIGQLGIAEKISVIITNADVANNKPHPEPYFKAAQMLGMKPEECVAVENSEKGVLSAKAAGMSCIAIPNKWTDDGDFSRADKSIKSLNEITLELIGQLGGK